MSTPDLAPLDLRSDIVLAEGEAPAFGAGQRVRVSTRAPIGHYRAPQYLRGRIGVVEGVMRPMAVDNEEEAYGRNAGSRGHYYRVRFAMAEVWPGYVGGARDALLIEVFQSWLQRT